MFLPAVGQGAIAITARAGDARALEAIAPDRRRGRPARRSRPSGPTWPCSRLLPDPDRRPRPGRGRQAGVPRPRAAPGRLTERGWPPRADRRRMRSASAARRARTCVRACPPASSTPDSAILVARPQADAERTARRRSARSVTTPSLRRCCVSCARTSRHRPAPFDALIVTSAQAGAPLAGLDRRMPVFVGLAVRSAGRRGRGPGVRGRELRRTATPPRSRRWSSGSLCPGARLLHVAGRDRKPEPAVCARRGRLPGVGVGRLCGRARAAPARCGRRGARGRRARRRPALLAPQRPRAPRARPDGRPREPFLGLAHLCLSADVAAPLRRAGARRMIVAERPDEEALLAKVQRGGSHRTRRRTERPSTGEGTNPPATVSISSPSPEEPIVTEPPPNTAGLPPRRAGSDREPPSRGPETPAPRTPAVPDEPARTGAGPGAGAGASAAEANPERAPEPLSLSRATPAAALPSAGTPAASGPVLSGPAPGIDEPGPIKPGGESRPAVAALPATDRTPFEPASRAASGEAADAAADRAMREAAEAQAKMAAKTTAETAAAKTAAGTAPPPPPEPRRGAGGLVGAGLLGDSSAPAWRSARATCFRREPTRASSASSSGSGAWRRRTRSAPSTTGSGPSMPR